MAGAVCAVSFLFSVLVCGFPEKLLIYGGRGTTVCFPFLLHNFLTLVIHMPEY